MLIRQEKNGISYFQFPGLLKFSGVRHGVFARHGGCSNPPFQSLNIGNGLGDDAAGVRQNRRAVARCIGCEDVVYIRQNHGAEIVVFEKSEAGGTTFARNVSMDADAMISNVSGKLLAVQVADCQAVLMLDPIRRVVANVHSGWRGSVKNILGRTVQVMIARFGCDPVDLSAGIGPSLGPCCAEFRNYRRELPEAFWKYKNEEDVFDFWKISRDQLVSEGLLPERIQVSGICTKCRTDLFFSYRGEGTTGRFAAAIGLAEDLIPIR